MKAEIITIGDEILIGQIVDTNSQWISTKLNQIGVSVYQISSIQDDKQHILNALKEAQDRADIVFITGGLGPTKDDITKHTITEYFKDILVLNQEVVSHIEQLFKTYNIPFSEMNRLQGMMPSKALYLKNDIGTAPGMWFLENKTIFISMPGVPNEMKNLMRKYVLPKIQDEFNLPHIIHKTVMTYGQGESVVSQRISDFENNLPPFIKLAYLPNYGRVRLRLTAKGDNKNILESTLEDLLKQLYQLIPDIISGLDETGTIENKVGKLLKERNQTICSAESITGGRIAANLVEIPGASSYFKGSIVAYSAELKQKLLNVSKNIIDKYSLVSKEVAEQMAINVREKLQTDYAISVTCNAGPSKDHNDKSIGLVYITIASKNGVLTNEFNFGQPREKVIKRTVNKALELLSIEILKN